MRAHQGGGGVGGGAAAPSAEGGGANTGGGSAERPTEREEYRRAQDQPADLPQTFDDIDDRKEPHQAAQPQRRRRRGASRGDPRGGGVLGHALAPFLRQGRRIIAKLPPRPKIVVQRQSYCAICAPSASSVAT